MKNLPLITFLFLALMTTFSCSDDEMEVMLQSTEFTYEVHNGQAVPSAAYSGAHNTDFTVTMKLDEMSNGNTMLTMTLDNTIDGETYHMHAHDAADASTTPNGTPYNEAPNGDIFAKMAVGNGSTVSVSQEAMISFSDLTSTYEGFFVVHDPLQAVNTTDISSYLVVGSFAREQVQVDYRTATFNYDFNTGQVAEAFAYSGTHATNLSATIQVDELAENRSRVTVRISNGMEGMLYRTHAHDMADPTTTPNGTPYNETPNQNIFAAPITANSAFSGEANVSNMSFDQITTDYNGFFVIHDPLQELSTTMPTTYVILGVFAR